ncbi:unnamed protein product [Boreogadus saida]
MRIPGPAEGKKAVFFILTTRVFIGVFGVFRSGFPLVSLDVAAHLSSSLPHLCFASRRRTFPTSAFLSLMACRLVWSSGPLCPLVAVGGMKTSESDLEAPADLHG